MKTKLYCIDIYTRTNTSFLKGDLWLRTENVYANSHAEAKQKAWTNFVDSLEDWQKDLFTRRNVRISSEDVTDMSEKYPEGVTTNELLTK